MRDAASSDERWRGGAGAFGHAYRPLPSLLVLCAFTAPLLFLAGCSASSRVEPRLAATASPRVTEQGQQPVSPEAAAAEPGKPYKVAGQAYDANGNPVNYSAEGLASWYGSAFHGRTTANGEVFDKESISAAHPSLPLPSYARVTNTGNGRSIIVRVNDRGPFHSDRALDVSERVAQVLDFKDKGMARVRIDYVGPASLQGSDNAKLMATYRENGRVPAYMVASAGSPTDMADLYKDPVQLRLATAHQMPAPAPAAAPQRQTQMIPQPVQASLAGGTTPPAKVASRIEAGFAGMSSPQPLTQQRDMTQPVLSGFAFTPTVFSAPR